MNWNDFQKNISSAFQEMRDDQDLADVTLACEGRKQFQAHKLVLSASSPVFKEIIRKNKHPHPLIYLKGMKAGALESVLDFLYRGEVNVYQQDLNDFLALAEDLELKGLTGQQPKDGGYLPNMQQVEENKIKKTYVNDNTPMLKTTPKSRKLAFTKEEPYFEQDTENQTNFVNTTHAETSIAAIEDDSMNIKDDELISTIENLCEKIGDKWNCKMCGQQAVQKITLKRHIESKHTEGGSHPCKVCGKIFRSSNSINTHMSKFHPK